MRYLMRSLSAPLLFASFVVLTLPASPQAAGPIDPAATLAYIHNGWDQLSRSVTDCQSLPDGKVTATPIPSIFLRDSQLQKQSRPLQPAAP